jgi:hypothetical protein
MRTLFNFPFFEFANPLVLKIVCSPSHGIRILTGKKKTIHLHLIIGHSMFVSSPEGVLFPVHFPLNQSIFQSAVKPKSTLILAC